MKRAHYWIGALLVLAFTAVLTIGALAQQQAYRTRGIPDTLPQPIPAGGATAGVNVDLAQSDPAGLDAALREIAATGFTAVKQPFYFSTTGDFDWERADALVSAVAGHQLTLVPLLDGDPATGFAPPADPADFAAWAAAFAARYGDRIDAYIIWDEPNLTAHWGMQPVNPNEYGALLSATAAAIRAADAGALIVAAPLAPTVETGPANLADHLYLQRLYEVGAADAFDVVAAKPYGFNSGPDDRQVSPDVLNFSRAILLREVVERNGEPHKAVWAGNWGWNALPPGWTGAPSLWGGTDEAQRAAWTTAALDRARAEWPWMGLMFLESWQPDVPADDPRQGFAIAGSETAVALADYLAGIDPAVAMPGFHVASDADPAQVYSGGWRFSPEFGADISEPDWGELPDTLSFTFWGTDAGLMVRRADFRGRLYVSVDGVPANALPSDENGPTLILTAPDPTEDYTEIVPVVRGLEPGVHTLEIATWLGWDQWALKGFSVGYRPADRLTAVQWTLAAVALLLTLAAGVMAQRSRLVDDLRGGWHSGRRRFLAFSDRVQLALVGVLAAVLGIAGWQLWGATAAGIYKRLGDLPQLALTAVTATVFYVSPWLPVYLLALVALLLLISYRPAWGLALITFSFPFYARADLFKAIAGFRFSPTEIFTWVTLAAFVLAAVGQAVQDWRAGARGHRNVPWLLLLSGAIGALFLLGQLELVANGWMLLALMPLILAAFARLLPQHRTADTAVILFVTAATASLFFTTRLDVALNEYWRVVVEPALFYLLLRAIRPSQREMWVILDVFVLSGVVVALIGLVQYATGTNLITAEGGLMRLRSVYGSPNNVALYLDRILPLLAAVVLFGLAPGLPETQRARRCAYTLALLPTGLAMLLTYSKGGLILGMPAAALVVGWIWLRRNGRSPWPLAIGVAVLGVAAVLVAQQIPALAARLDLTGTTGVFRLNLWRSSLEMLREHPWFGVGLDNFLYAYRGRYIFDASWPEPNLSHPHNILLDFATRLGLLGLLAGGWLFWQLLHALRRALHTADAAWLPVAVGFCGALAALLAHGLVDHSVFLVDLAFGVMLLLATAVWLAYDITPDVASRRLDESPRQDA